MSLKIMKTLWGVNYTKETIKYLPSIYNGLEVALDFADFDQAHFKDLMKQNKKSLIAQIHTCGYPIRHFTVKEHFDSFRQKAENALSWNPQLINVHSGYDGWSLEESIKFFELCSEFEKQFPVKIAHETHRQRALYSPFLSLQILKAVPSIRLNADLSHWILVCERLFEIGSEQADEPFWNELHQIVINRSLMVHARIGAPQQIQIIDPSLPEHEALVSYYFSIWEKILKKNKALFFTCEFGPQPYMIAMPKTQEDMVNLDQVNLTMALMLQSKFNNDV